MYCHTNVGSVLAAQSVTGFHGRNAFLVSVIPAISFQIATSFRDATFDDTTGVFRCQTQGYYEFTLALVSDGGNPVSVSIYRNEEPLAGAYAAYRGDVNSAVTSVIALCSPGDEFQLRCEVYSPCSVGSATVFQALMLDGLFTFERL